jgi:hypothetical protein
MGITLRMARQRVHEAFGPAGSASTDTLEYTPRTKEVLELSLREALQLGHDQIGTEHLLLALIRESGGRGAQVLMDMGLDLSVVRREVFQLLSGYTVGPSNSRHQADHTAIQTAFEESHVDPEARDGILRDTLILHLGGFHGWTVAANGNVLGLAPMLARHDRDHETTDVLAVEARLDPRIVEAVKHDRSDP